MDVALVPVHLDALYLARPAQVAAPLIRPDRLPWSTGAADRNAERPWLGQTIDMPPFDTAGHLLPAGVHLHWALPDGLTRGDGANAFPFTPDRWLVRCSMAGNHTDWVVESDFVGAGVTATDDDTLFPEPAAPENRPPFSVQGRRQGVAEWLRSGPAGTRRPITAMGYGDPKFAAYYPSCRGVFGLHDADADTRQALEYAVLGWYSHLSEDPLSLFQGGFATRPEQNLAQAVADRFHWVLSDANAPWQADRMVCYARLTLRVQPGREALDKRVSLAIGDTGVEALGALAKSIARDSGHDIERTIDALHLGDQIAHRATDHAPLLAAAAHERGFLAESGGHRWTLMSEIPVDAPAHAGTEDAVEDAPPPGLAVILDRLNDAQASFDRGTRQVDALRTQIFADWSKYMMLVYPSINADAVPMDAEQVRYFLRDQGLDPLNRLIVEVGDDPVHEQTETAPRSRLFLDDFGALASPPGNGGSLQLPPGNAQGSLGERLEHDLSGCLRELEIFNATRLSGQRIGDPQLTTDAATGAGYLSFDGKADALIADRIEGWPGTPKRGGTRGLHGLGLMLRFRIDAAQTAEILSFGADAHFSLGLDRGGGIRFVTVDAAGRADMLLSTAPVPLGQWVELAASYDAADGRKRLWIDGRDAGQTTVADAPLLGTSAVRGGVIGAASAGPDTAGGGRFAGRIARVIVMPDTPLGDTQAKELAARKLPAPLRLKRTSGARYWRPRDPAVLLKGPAVAETGRYERGDLLCHVVNDPHLGALWDDDRQAQIAALDSLRAALSRAIAAAGKNERGVRKGDGAPWHPLFLDWQTALHPFSQRGPHVANRDSYAEDYITADFSLQPGGPDIAPNPGIAPIANRVSVVSGRAVLTPHVGNLTDHLHATAAKRGLVQTALPQTAAQAHHQTQSQALSGVHAALLQHRVATGLPPDDPLAFGDRRAFSRTTIRAAVGRRPISAATPNQPFLPIRAGKLDVRRLRVVDAFGQTLDLPTEAIARAGGKTIEGHGAAALLPPRLSQPARLDFRWLAANPASTGRIKGEAETNEHPATSPICGWLVANYLDRGLALYAADGTALGEVTPDRTRPWRSAPGRDTPIRPQDFGNDALVRVAQALSSLDHEKRQSFLDAVADALGTILPDMQPGNAELSLIVGRPLAIVRVSLALGLRDPPAIDQSWESFRRDLTRRRRDHAGFTRVRFPVRLGEAGRLDDGLVGFWREDAEGLPTGDFHMAAIQSGASLKGLRGPADAGFDLQLALDDPPLTLTMLVDPLGSVHATSGILPVKDIAIPRAHFQETLKRIEIWSLAAPILTGRGRLAKALPDIPDKTWEWTQRDGESWITLPADKLMPPRADAAFDGPTEIREGWLTLSPARET